MGAKKQLMKIVIPLVSVLLAFVVGGIVIFGIGKNPMEAFGYLFQGAFGSRGAVSGTLVKATPLIFTGLAATFAYKCGVFNLGAEGQFIMGAVTAVWFSTTFTSLPGLVSLLAGLALGAVAGGLWGAVPGLLKAFRGLNEMIVSILLNYVATLFMSYLFTGPLKEASIPQTAAVPDGAKLPQFIPGMRVHAGLLIALAAAGIIYYYLFCTSGGMKLRAVGFNATASMVNGFAVKRFMLMSFIASGAIAGLGGAVELHGTSFRLMAGFGAGFGFDGVAIALIGQLNPLGTVLVAYLFAVLRMGANSMQVGSGIPTSVVGIIQALVIIFVVAGSAMTNLPQVKAFFQKMKREVA